MRAPFLSASLWRKLLVTSIAIVSFVLLYEVGTFDSLTVPRAGAIGPAALPTGTRHLFAATAYCKGTTTASGVNVRTGIAASDPQILPVGSVVNVTSGIPKYNGVYTIMDTGPRVQGRHLDIYMWSCYDALDFGRQQIELTVLRLGWNPQDSVPSLVDRLFRRREAARTPPPRRAPAPSETVEGAPATSAPVEPAPGAPADPALQPAPPAPETSDPPAETPPAEPPAPAAPSAPVASADVG
jgi:3D (Asp-Asp-Asp) domain-containing protein